MSDHLGMSVFRYLAFGSQLSLGIVFLLSTLPKMRHPLAFVESVVQYEVLPKGVARAFAVVVIPLEAFLAVAFLTGWSNDAALLLGTAVVLAFLIGTGVNLRRGRRVSCGCFGSTSEPISARTFARLLMLMSVILLLATFRSSGGGSLVGLGLIMAGAPAVAYLLQAAFLAAFLVLLGAWTLRSRQRITCAKDRSRVACAHGRS